MGEDRSEPRAVPSAEDAASAFDAVLDALSRMVSPVLIDGSGWDRLRDAVRGLPVDPGIGFGFELQVGRPAAGSDFYIALPHGSLLSEHYIRLGEGSPPGSAAAALGDRLATIRTRAPWSEILGLEFDAMSGLPGARPGLFVRLRSDPAGAGDAAVPDGNTVAAWLTGAVGWRLADRERQAICGIFDRLTAAGGSVDCLGIMPARPDRAFKVNSRPMEPARAVRVLEGLRWGAAREVAAFLAEFGGLFRSLRLAIGVTADGVLPRIGLELFQGDAGSLSHPGVGEWAPFLARLCEGGLCLPEKMEALKAWPGREFVFHGQDTFGILTGIAHLKVSFEEGKGGRAAVEAKAYPAAGYLPFDMIGAR